MRFTSMSTPNGNAPPSPDSSGDKAPRSAEDSAKKSSKNRPFGDATLPDDLDQRTLLESNEKQSPDRSQPIPSEDMLARTLPESFFEKTISEESPPTGAAGQ